MQVMERDTAIQKAQSLMEEATRDRDFMHEYTLRQMALSDWTTGVNTAHEKGLAEGIEKGILQGITQGISQGMEKGILKTAAAFKNMGISAEQITLATGLSLKQIAEL